MSAKNMFMNHEIPCGVVYQMTVINCQYCFYFIDLRGRRPFIKNFLRGIWAVFTFDWAVF